MTRDPSSGVKNKTVSSGMHYIMVIIKGLVRGQKYNGQRHELQLL